MSGARGARVSVHSEPLWLLRASLGASRWLLRAAALAGIAVTVRTAVAPAVPRTVPRPAAPRTRPQAGDGAGAWFAQRFARAYLTWSADPAGQEEALAAFLGAGDAPSAGLTPAAGSRETVVWTALAQARADGSAVTDYTVAAGLADGSVRYLALAVAHPAGSAPALARYPALVGAPPAGTAGALDGAGLAPLGDPALAAVLDRALGNYLGGSRVNLAADLAPGAAVVPPPPGLALRAVTRLARGAPRRVLATVLAVASDGSAYTLTYEIALTRAGGRWEITQINP